MGSITNEMTSSKTGTFYFAFGSNLSPTQMRGRLDSSLTSSIPIAIASLPGWKWLICQRGYANIVELPSDTLNSDSSTVWGVLYNLTPDDEEILDMYEGHDEGRNPKPKPNPDVSQRMRKPFEQGDWDYNKHYLPVTVAKWLVEPTTFGLREGTSSVRVLTYVDEFRTVEGTIKQEYIGRMNRAMDESVQLGMPRSWCEKVMRKWVAEGVYPPPKYIGTSQGYVEEDEVGTEAS
jgi:hypothetical protein